MSVELSRQYAYALCWMVLTVTTLWFACDSAMVWAWVSILSVGNATQALRLGKCIGYVDAEYDSERGVRNPPGGMP